MAKKKSSHGYVKNNVYVIPEKEKFNWFFVPIIFVLFFVPVIVQLVIHETDEQSAAIYGYYYSDFYNAAKGVYLMIGMAVMLIVGISAVFLIKKITKDTDRLTKFYLIAGGAFILFTLISACLAVNKGAAFGGLCELGEGFFTFLAYITAFLYTMLMFGKEKDFRYIAVTLMAVIVINLIVGISQYAGNDILKNTEFGRALIIPSKYSELSGNLTTHLGKESMFGTFGHYNHMGTFAAMMVPLFTIIAVTANEMKIRIAMGITAVASTVLLFGSTARGGLVGLAAAVIFAVILFSRQLISHWKITLSVIGAGAVLAVGLNFVTGGKIFSRIPAMVSDLLYIGNSDTVSEDYLDTLAVHDIVNLEDGTVKISAKEKELKLSFTDGKFTVSDGDESADFDKDGAFGELFFSYTHADAEASHPEDGALDLLILNYDSKPLFYFRGTAEGAHLVSPYTLENIDLQYPEVADYFKGKEKIGSARGYIWGRTLPFLKETWLVGYGPDNFVFNFPQYDLVGKYYAYGTTNMVVSRPHNVYMQIFVNNGGLAFLAFLAIMIVYAVDSLKLYCFKKKYTALQGLGVALFLAAVGYLAAGMFNDSLKHTSIVFWILLGAGAAVNGICRIEEKETAE